MSTLALEIIAVVTMLIDSLGIMFISPSDYPLILLISSCIGRISLPIILFLLVESFNNTANRKKYLQKLGLLAVISEIPFDLALYKYHFQTDFISDFKSIFDAGYNDDNLLKVLKNLFTYQNLIFTFFIGMLLLYFIGIVEKKYANNMSVSNLVNGALTIVFCLIAVLIRADVSIAGILLLVAFYLFRGNNALLGISILIVGSITQKNVIATILALASLLAIIPICLYKGKKGKDIKYLFYIFYPAHLLLLYLVSIFI